MSNVALRDMVHWWTWQCGVNCRTSWSKKSFPTEVTPWVSLNAPATPSQSNKSPKGCLVLQWRWPSEQSKPGGSGRARCLQERSVKFQGRAESVTPAGVCLFLDTPITNYKTQPHRKICAYRFLLKSAVLVLMLQWTSQQDTQKPLGLLRLWF